VVKKNVCAFRSVLAHALGKYAGTQAGRRLIDKDVIGGLSSEELNERLVEKCVSNYLAEAGTDRVAKESRIRGVVSTIRQARSIFAKPAMKCYRDLHLPDLRGFMEAAVPQAKAPPQTHLESTAIEAMAKAALKLRETNPNLYLVHLLARHLGMRNDEIESARMEWIERRSSEVWLPNGERREIAAIMAIRIRSDWEPKQSEGEVPISPDVLAEIDALTADRAPQDYIVAGPNMTARADLVNREHNDFVRHWTKHCRKKGYEMRRWAATLVAERQGEEMAERFLRHKAKSVAWKFYLTRQVPPAPITFADCGLTAPAEAS
jgi:hypothetical protein